MSSRQGPSGLRVVVRRWTPANCGMADLALLRNSSRHVIRIRCALVIPQMASDARCAGEIKVPVGMALLTWQLGVPSGQGESDGIVIEVRWLPCRCRVAHLASLRNSQGQVIRIGGLLIIGQVATNAGRRSPLVPPADMASDAIQGGVHACQRESCGRVIELCPEPMVDGVALLTLDWKGGRRMLGGGRLLISFLMTGVALNRQTHELTDGLALVTVRAVQSRMPAEQRKTVCMFSNRLQNNAPALHCVALFAVRPHLATVNVCMTVSAVDSGIR